MWRSWSYDTFISEDCCRRVSQRSSLLSYSTIAPGRIKTTLSFGWRCTSWSEATFKKIEIFFYVRGHTQNVCDRMFNQLKLDFHKRNIHVFEQMMNLLNLHPHTMEYDYPTDKLFAYGEMLDAFYKPMTAGSNSQESHVFGRAANRQRATDVHKYAS
jgi:hypothetical protein